MGTVKSPTKYCPFCQLILTNWDNTTYNTYGCINKNCVVDDMPRYQITYNKYPTYLVSKTFMLNDWYVQISYLNKTTTISKLHISYLLDNIELPRILDIDFTNTHHYYDKIKTFLIFS